MLIRGVRMLRSGDCDITKIGNEHNKRISDFGSRAGSGAEVVIRLYLLPRNNTARPLPTSYLTILPVRLVKTSIPPKMPFNSPSSPSLKTDIDDNDSAATRDGIHAHHLLHTLQSPRSRSPGTDRDTNSNTKRAHTAAARLPPLIAPASARSPASSESSASPLTPPPSVPPQPTPNAQCFPQERTPSTAQEHTPSPRSQSTDLQTQQQQQQNLRSDSNSNEILVMEGQRNQAQANNANIGKGGCW